MAKRPDGALEHDIMAVLWAADHPLRPGDIKNRRETELADAPDWGRATPRSLTVALIHSLDAVECRLDSPDVSALVSCLA